MVIICYHKFHKLSQILWTFMNTMIVHGWIFQGCQWFSVSTGHENFTKILTTQGLTCWRISPGRTFGDCTTAPRSGDAAPGAPYHGSIQYTNWTVACSSWTEQIMTHFVFGWRIRSSALSFLWVPSFPQKTSCKTGSSRANSSKTVPGWLQMLRLVCFEAALRRKELRGGFLHISALGRIHQIETSLFQNAN